MAWTESNWFSWPRMRHCQETLFFSSANRKSCVSWDDMAQTLNVRTDSKIQNILIQFLYIGVSKHRGSFHCFSVNNIGTCPYPAPAPTWPHVFLFPWIWSAATRDFRWVDPISCAEWAEEDQIYRTWVVSIFGQAHWGDICSQRMLSRSGISAYKLDIDDILRMYNPLNFRDHVDIHPQTCPLSRKDSLSCRSQP